MAIEKKQPRLRELTFSGSIGQNIVESVRMGLERRGIVPVSHTGLTGRVLNSGVAGKSSYDYYLPHVRRDVRGLVVSGCSFRVRYESLESEFSRMHIGFGYKSYTSGLNDDFIFDYCGEKTVRSLSLTWVRSPYFIDDAVGRFQVLYRLAEKEYHAYTAQQLGGR